jgi:hypothetical protein
MGVPLWEFQDSHLGILRQNDIWMWALWRGTKYTIRGKVVASSKSRPWWILWIQICPWLILAPKVLQLCINQLVWFCAGLCEWMIAYHFPSPISEFQHGPLPPKCYEPKNMSLTPCSFVVFTLNSHLILSRSLGAHHSQSSLSSHGKTTNK